MASPSSAPNCTTTRLFSHGSGADPFWTLRLDSNDRPRLAFFQDTPDLNADWFTTPPGNCTSSGWDAGYDPTLALRSADTLVLAHHA